MDWIAQDTPLHTQQNTMPLWLVYREEELIMNMSRLPMPEKRTGIELKLPHARAHNCVLLLLGHNVSNEKVRWGLQMIILVPARVMENLDIATRFSFQTFWAFQLFSAVSYSHLYFALAQPLSTESPYASLGLSLSSIWGFLPFHLSFLSYAQKSNRSLCVQGSLSVSHTVLKAAGASQKPLLDLRLTPSSCLSSALTLKSSRTGWSEKQAWWGLTLILNSSHSCLEMFQK